MFLFKYTIKQAIAFRFTCGYDMIGIITLVGLKSRKVSVEINHLYGVAVCCALGMYWS